MATILIIFWRINRPSWQILCSLYTYAYVLSGELLGRAGPLGAPPFLATLLHPIHLS